MVRISVDFPHPFGPRMQTCVPLRLSAETLRPAPSFLHESRRRCSFPIAETKGPSRSSSRAYPASRNEPNGAGRAPGSCTAYNKKEAKTQGFRLPGWGGVLLTSPCGLRSLLLRRTSSLYHRLYCATVFRDAPKRTCPFSFSNILFFPCQLKFHATSASATRTHISTRISRITRPRRVRR
jgi:hypothetical protein